MLWRVIETEFALIVQDDGWILDSSNWTDDFLKYDYIGAPIHLAKVTDLDLQSSEWVRGFAWAGEINNPSKKLDIIQNGGFSLRSQKLMRALCELNMSVEVPPPTIIGDQPLSMRWHNDCLYEDVQLSGILKDKLISHGINFAPPDVARKFSIEHAGPILHDNFSYSSLFGHHSKLRKLKSISPLAIEYAISPEEIDTIHGERNIHDLFISLNYQIQYKR